MEEKQLLTKEEMEEVLKELAPKFKHIEPHVILLVYAFIKNRGQDKKSSPPRISGD